MIVGLSHASGQKTFVNSDHIVSFADRDETINPIKPGISGQWLAVVHMSAGPTPLFIVRPNAHRLAEILEEE